MRPIRHRGARAGLTPRPGTTRPRSSLVTGRGERGMVTVEAAIAIPAILVGGLLSASVPAVVAGQVACADAAREAALLIARGANAAEVDAAVDALAPDGAVVRVGRAGHTVWVEVTASVSLGAGPLAGRAWVPLSGHAVAAREPGV